MKTFNSSSPRSPHSIHNYRAQPLCGQLKSQVSTGKAREPQVGNRMSEGRRRGRRDQGAYRAWVGEILRVGRMLREWKVEKDNFKNFCYALWRILSLEVKVSLALQLYLIFGLVLFWKQSYTQTDLGGRPNLHGLRAGAPRPGGWARLWSHIGWANDHTWTPQTVSFPFPLEHAGLWVKFHLPLSQP